jgi:ribose 5-phosphate isomerase B
MKAKIGVAADHGGKDLKRLVVDFLQLTDFEVVDYGVASNTDKSVDYPDYARVLAQDVSAEKIERGIAICGTGLGMCITANKFPKVRAVSVWDEYTARMSRQHNNANIICLGGRTINHHRAVDFVKIWLETSYEGGRHEERLKKIYEIEKKNLKPQV